MSFIICGLNRKRFENLFSQSTAELAAKSIVRKEIAVSDGAPCRVSLADLEPGESALLLNYPHLPAASPFQSSHAIYIGENRKDVRLSVSEVPIVMRSRLVSVRFFDDAQMMLDADVVDGNALADTLTYGFKQDKISFIDIHYAKPGCWAARARRVA